MSRLCALPLQIVLAIAGCRAASASTSQSALSPLGIEAARIDTLFWIMTIAGTIIFGVVLTLVAVAAWGGDRLRVGLSRERIIIGCGLVFPIVVLTALLGYGLYLMGTGSSSHALPGDARILVVGERWWWRVVYTMPDGRRVESANEIRIPAGRPVQIALRTADVIHSFWVPRLAGKLDMIPGRTNVLTLNALEPGVSRGQCAEYCGGAHALMSFYVVAMPEADHAAWLEREAGSAASPESDVAARGRALFADYGCGGCHTIRGTEARGGIGPDLTHVGGRLSLAAATLANRAEDFARWIRDGQHVKPENLMPPYRNFSEADLRALSLYLEGLE